MSRQPVSGFLAIIIITLVGGRAHAQTSGREVLDHPKRTYALDRNTLDDLKHWKELLSSSRVAIRHLDFTIANDGHATRSRVSSGDLVPRGDDDYARLREKNQLLVDELIARTERQIKVDAIQPTLGDMPGATDPLLKDWFQGIVLKTKGEKLDLADAIHYYLKRRVTSKIALDIAESGIEFKFYDPDETPPSNPKDGDVWLRLGQPFPLIAAKAVELGSLALQNGKETPTRVANALLRALHFLALKKVPDGLSFDDDPLFSRGAELRSNPDALVALVSERMGGLSKKDKAKVEDKSFHHYTKHLSDEALTTAPTGGLAAKIVSSMVGKETPLETIKRMCDARDALFDKYGTPATISTSELRAILDRAVKEAGDPAKDVVDR
jgi:hypothetical protein